MATYEIKPESYNIKLNVNGTVGYYNKAAISRLMAANSNVEILESRNIVLKREKKLLDEIQNYIYGKPEERLEAEYVEYREAMRQKMNAGEFNKGKWVYLLSVKRKEINKLLAAKADK